MRTIGHWIGGVAAGGSSARRAVVWDPATGTQQAEVVLAGPDDVDLAVSVAEAAWPDWASSSLSARTKILFTYRDLVQRRADDLARIVAAEHGKALGDARGEIQRGLEVVELACGIAELLKGDYSDQVSGGVDVFSYRQPLGVTVGITPFKFPVMVPMWMFPLAIACGNAFVLKPSERDPSPSLVLAELWAEAGLPDGVFNVVQGDREAVERLLVDPRVAAVSFVGSTPVARRIFERATANGKRVQALGGAKNHAVVLPDVDIGHAAEQLTAAAFGSAGERCMAISAAVVMDEVAGLLVEAVCERARRIRVGPGTDPETEMGPVVSPDARDRVIGTIDRAQADGASVVLDGRGCHVPGYDDGFFVGPTVVDNVLPEMDVYRQEVFGPVLSVLRVRDVEEAIALVNASPYGNGAAVFTNSGDAARRFHRAVTVGMVGINVPIPVPVAYYSFGGWKDSLFGDHHVHGPEGVSFYTRGKVVTARWPEQIDAAASLHFPTTI